MLSCIEELASQTIFKASSLFPGSSTHINPFETGIGVTVLEGRGRLKLDTGFHYQWNRDVETQINSTTTKTAIYNHVDMDKRNFILL